MSELEGGLIGNGGMGSPELGDVPCGCLLKVCVTKGDLE